MFEDERVLDWCIENKITVTQYLFMLFIIQKAFHKPFPESYAKRYIKSFGMFKAEDVADLVERGYVEDFNTRGESRPEFYVVRDEVITLMKTTDDNAEELWQAYPPTFEIPGNINYVARHAGPLGDKENAKKTYQTKIKRSKKKHQFVMRMLAKYLGLVANGRINSMKLGDWIANEMWDSVEQIKEEDGYAGIEFK